MAGGFSRVSRPFHGRHRFLHPGALALRRRARGLVAQVARRPAAQRGRADRMEERRTPVRLALAAGLAFSGVAGACVPEIKGTQLESSRYVLSYQAQSVAVGKHFSI